MHSDGLCIHPSFVCDGFDDCKEAEDEKNCTTKSKEDTKDHGVKTSCEKQGFFQCHDGLCIHPSLVCDGFEDCVEAKDEKNCTTKSKEDTKDHGVKTSCEKQGFFQCHNGLCILPSLVCDGFEDCREAEDEKNRKLKMKRIAPLNQKRTPQIKL
eukprot:TRINITY_DN3510_c0_g1_i12.p1 TRINITY_DN3510_c0_g1~~TRINITY_DN3510_c0_g1_i12.p1  ORF type:complete len:154 (+),score=15.69 TRINITY_DN3510_c0_g1_i12:44-505(+)